MSVTTVIYLLVAAAVVGGGVGLLAKMSVKEIVAQVGLMGLFALSFYGLVALLM